VILQTLIELQKLNITGDELLDPLVLDIEQLVGSIIFKSGKNDYVD